MNLFNLLEQISKEYEFDVSCIKGYFYIKKSLPVSQEFDVEIKAEDGNGRFISRGHALKNGIYIWGRGADVLCEGLNENSQFIRAAINLISRSSARIELSKGVALIQLGANGFSGSKSDASEIRLFFRDAEKISNGFVEAARSIPENQEFTNLTRFRFGPRSWRNSMIFIFIMVLLIFTIARYRN